MKYVLYALVALALLAGGYYFMAGEKQGADMGDAKNAMEGDVLEMKDGAGMEGGAANMTGETSMDDHMKMMDDGKTVMIMGGAASPALLHVAPGAELRLANHENVPLTLVFGGNALQVAEVAAGAEGMFKAPTKVGRYEYVVSSNPAITGVIVVEE